MGTLVVVMFCGGIVEPYGDGRDVVMSYRSASSVARMLRKWCVSIPFKRPVSCAFAVKYAHMSAHCARVPPAAASKLLTRTVPKAGLGKIPRSYQTIHMNTYPAAVDKT